MTEIAERLAAWKLCLDQEELPEVLRSNLNDLYLILLAIQAKLEAPD